MSPGTGFTTYEALPPGGRVHISARGRSVFSWLRCSSPWTDVDVRLYEKRDEYTRTRMVHLEPYLAADSIESYCTDPHRRRQRPGRLRSGSSWTRPSSSERSIPSDLMTLLRGWTRGLLPAERHRAVAQRSDRRARVGLRAAHGGQS